MLKLIGLLSLTLAAGLIGVMKTCRLKERIGLLEDFLKMILELKVQINYFREPLTTVFLKAGKNYDSRAFSFLHDCRDDIDAKEGEIAEIWSQNADLKYKSTSLDSEDIKLIKYAGTFIGQTDYDNQLYQFDYLEEKLKDRIENACQILKRKGPMYNRVGFFCGAIIAIILL